MPKTIYFGYGSNLWLDQMKRRCPESKYIGVGKLVNWKWIIACHGYANIIPSPGDVVYGLVYELTATDEYDLDTYERVFYEKKFLSVKLARKSKPCVESVVRALIYIDCKRKEESYPRKEYIYRMNMGIADALAEGIPEDYVNKYLRPFISPPHGPVLINNSYLHTM